ncbi:RNase H family protein [Kytococcus sedentarius]|uniref:RNase H family protein n=1 Tax=Kytococcus sedentarius TaxID=1276 RepID=UPI0035BBFD0D
MITAAADGSALGNPGPAGWAWYVDDDCWAAGGWDHGTNNMGELMAVLDLLQQTAHLDDDLHVLCDSQYAINVISKWTPGWKRKGWKKADGKPVMNIELVKALDEAMQGRRVTFEWVKGHAGHAMNEAADERARNAALAHQRGDDPDPGPGFASASTDHPTAVVGARSDETVPTLFEDLPTSDAETVLALERSLLTDTTRTDPAEVAALLHSDWYEVGASGRVWTREEMLAEIGPLPEPVEVEVLSTSALDAHTLLLLWRAVTASGASVRTSLWVRESGRWRQRFHQGTREP